MACKSVFLFCMKCHEVMNRTLHCIHEEMRGCILHNVYMSALTEMNIFMHITCSTSMLMHMDAMYVQETLT